MRALEPSGLRVALTGRARRPPAPALPLVLGRWRGPSAVCIVRREERGRGRGGAGGLRYPQVVSLREMLDRNALLLVVASAGCSSRAPVPPAALPEARCASVALAPLTVDQAAWSRLEVSLRHRYDVWRARLAASRCDRPRGDLAALESERVTVSVEYEGDAVRALREAGLRTGYDSGREVSGQVGLRDLERLAGVQGVVRVTAQPEDHPD